MRLSSSTSLVLLKSLPGETGRWWTRAREFFAYHGVWAIGVRLLRRMKIRDKMLLVLAACLGGTAAVTALRAA